MRKGSRTAASFVLVIWLAGCGRDGGGEGKPAPPEAERTAVAPAEIAPVEKEPTLSWPLPTPDSLGEGERLGHSVAIAGDTAVVGAVNIGTRVRGAYVYRYQGGEWELWQHLPLQDQGFSAFIPGRETIEIHESTIAVETARAVFVYRLEGESWVQDARIAGAQMGGEQISGMALGKDALAITVRTKDNDYVLQVFSRSQSGWSEGTTLATESESESWGGSLTFQGDLLVAGSGLDGRRGPRRGSTTVFRYDGNRWRKEVDLVASDGDDYHRFGTNVAVDEDRIIVGAPGFRDADGREMGALYDFTYDGERWVESGKILYQGEDRAPTFGSNLSLSGDLLLVGDDWANAGNSGAVYVYGRDGSSWTLAATILEDPPVAEQGFGFDVDLDSHRAIVSSWGRTGMQIGALMGRPAEEAPKPPIQRGAAIYDLQVLLARRRDVSE